MLRDPASGRPSGVLLEAAGRPVEETRSRTQTLSAEQHRQAFRRGVEILSSYGVTAFQDAAVSLEILDALASLDRAGELDAWSQLAHRQRPDLRLRRGRRRTGLAW